MSDVAEGLGGAIEGALTGKAVERQTGGKANHEAPENSKEACLNCESPVSGSFCSNCGQKTHIHRTLTAIGHDLIHGVLHLDGKLWRTLPQLAFKPGLLTRRYIDGKRADFVSPMAMFLFSVFTMFAVFQMIGLTTPTTLDVGDPAEIVRTQGEAQASELRDQIAALSQDDPERAERQQELAVLEELLERAEVGSLTSEQVVAEMVDTARKENPNNSSAVLDGIASMMSNQEGDDTEFIVTGIEALDQGILKKWSENPGLMLYKLQANAYKFSWLLIPLSIPFVWITFAWRGRFKAYDHAIFVTYSLAFMSLLFIAASILISAGSFGALGVLLIIFVPPIHLYKQLRGAYGLSRFSALWRLFVLSAFIWIVALLFLQALFLLGAF